MDGILESNTPYWNTELGKKKIAHYRWKWGLFYRNFGPYISDLASDGLSGENRACLILQIQPREADEPIIPSLINGFCTTVIDVPRAIFPLCSRGKPLQYYQVIF